MSGELGKYLAATACDVLSLLGVPTTLANETLATIMRQRQETARDILLEELRRGGTTLPETQVDELVPILYRYGRAAQEGAARLNLRLLAQTITGRVHQGALYADEFLRVADVLAGLKREEILLLAKQHHVWSSDWLQDVPEGARAAAALRWCVAKLTPDVMRDEQTVLAVSAGLVRTGFLVSIPAIGVTMYQPTSLLDELVSLSSLEAALEAES